MTTEHYVPTQASNNHLLCARKRSDALNPYYDSTYVHMYVYLHMYMYMYVRTVGMCLHMY